MAKTFFASGKMQRKEKWNKTDVKSMGWCMGRSAMTPKDYFGEPPSPKCYWSMCKVHLACKTEVRVIFKVSKQVAFNKA